MKKFLLAYIFIISFTTIHCNGQNQKSDPWVDYVETSHNPIVTRISQQEIIENKTPAAVAYNFVMAILENDFNKMLRNATHEFKSTLQDALSTEYKWDVEALIKDNFSEGKLGILSWKPALKNGYEVAVAFIQDESYYYENGSWYCPFEKVLKGGEIYLTGETYPRTTKVTKKIYITCSPSSEVNRVGFQDITRYGHTNVKPLVEYNNGRWLVVGFK